MAAADPLPSADTNAVPWGAPEMFDAAMSKAASPPPSIWTTFRKPPFASTVPPVYWIL